MIQFINRGSGGPLTQAEYDTCLELSKKILETPSGDYIQLDYLESSGTQQIDINDFTPTNDTRYEIVISNLAKEANQGIMGAATTWQQGRSILYTGTADGKVALFWAYSTILPHIALLKEDDFVNKHKISVYRNQLIVDDVTINDDTTDGNVPIGDTFKLFKVLQLSSSIRIHSCKLYENEELKKDIIPVRRTSDNVKCFYDLISKKYYVNQGTGDLINA